MKSNIFKHTPNYGQFYVQDPVHYDYESTARLTREDIDLGFYVGEGMITVFVISQYSEIPIEVEVMAEPPTVDDFSKWDRVVEGSLTLKSGHLALVGCPDGPEYGTFGKIDLAPGSYAVRVYYGGQDTVQENGDTLDFYKLEIWPCSEFQARFLKP
jgi:hypothetical protein